MAENPMQHRVLIADDEAPARRELRRLLSVDPSLVVVGEAQNGLDAFTQAMAQRPDIVFLDIQMPALTGIETAEQFLANHYYPLIVFVTAYDAYAVKAFELHAIDYILKPVRKERLDMVLKRIHMQLDDAHPQDGQERLLRLISSLQEGRQPCRIALYQGDKIIPIRIDEIIYAEASGRCCKVMTKDGLFSTAYSMHELQEILPSSRFFPCHRSYLVNLDCIESVQLWVNSTYRLKMTGSDTLVPVSRSSTAALKQFLHLL
jgi:DNA-binding LytR/AlgR family response regulator